MDGFQRFLILFLITLHLKSCVPRPQHHNMRIHGGEMAEPGQFPFVVSINIINGYHWCGASIINDNWVVTAAHCMVDWIPAELVVLAGTNLIDTAGTAHPVSTIISHPDYDKSSLNNDIALLKIEGAFSFRDSVQRIQLEEVSEDDPVTVIGWGDTGVVSSSNELRYADLTTLSDEDCTRLSQGGTFVRDRGPGQVCALGSEGISPCYGDSGGPLVSNGTLVGIVSYAISPCANGYPDVYTRIAYYRDWINETLAKN